MAIKPCPHCLNGQVFTVKDKHEHYDFCLQCGYYKEYKIWHARCTPAPMQARLQFGTRYAHEINRGLFTERYLATRV